MMKVKETTELLGKSEQFVIIGLQRGILPFGYAVKMSTKMDISYLNGKIE